MKNKTLLFAGLVGVGAVIGATLTGTNEPDTESTIENSKNILPAPSNIISPSDSADLQTINQTLALLQNQLQQEIDHRKLLEEKIALLEKSVNSGDSDKTNTPTSTESSQSPHQAGFSSQSFGGQNNDWFNEQAMLDAGVDSVKVKFIKDAFEQAEMDKLYLRDQAKRENWINSKRYTDAAKEIADRTKALRDQLDDNEYDAYLYAAGRPNRVTVASMLSASPASNAGIKPGDAIIKYDNKRIYNWSDLTSATSDGSLSDTVAVTIERDGQIQQVYIPRGPLGVRLNTDSVAP